MALEDNARGALAGLVYCKGKRESRAVYKVVALARQAVVVDWKVLIAAGLCVDKVHVPGLHRPLSHPEVVAQIPDVLVLDVYKS